MSAKNSPTLRDRFQNFAHKISEMVGSVWAFLFAIGTVVVWCITGPLFGFSDTWQLVINTGTTIITFIMVFLIQSTQNRDAKAMHLKLDELLRALRGARNELIDVEDRPEKDLDALDEKYARLQKRALSKKGKRQPSANSR